MNPTNPSSTTASPSPPRIQCLQKPRVSTPIGQMQARLFSHRPKGRWVLLAWIGVLISASLLPASSQTTILSEDFEGAFPGAWSLGDSNPSGTTAYWKDVNLMSFGTPPIHGSGSYAGYCAGVGYGGTMLSPVYQNSMDA